ncbi:MAG: tetratricopeptide repeat protein [Vicinamibacterales bacterium]
MIVAVLGARRLILSHFPRFRVPESLTPQRTRRHHRLSRTQMGRLDFTAVIWLVAGLTPSAALCAPALATTAQVAPAQPSVEERLKRVAADLFVRMDRIGDAIRELQAILAIDPRSAQAHMLLGNAYVGEGAPERKGEAIAEFRQALEIDPSLVAARFYMADVYLDLGRTDMARDELQLALSQAPGQPQFTALLGEAERRLGHAPRSVELIRQALQADPSLTEARYHLSLALLDLGQHADAIREMEQLVQSGVDIPDVQLTLGTAYVDAGRLDAAVTTLTRAASLAPARPDIRIQLARGYRLKGLLREADAQLALLPAPGSALMIQNPVAYQRLSVARGLELGELRMAQGRLLEATTAFTKALEADPEQGRTHERLAEVYLRRGEYRLALDHAVRAAVLGVPLAADRRLLLDQKIAAPGGSK